MLPSKWFEGIDVKTDPTLFDFVYNVANNVANTVVREKLKKTAESDVSNLNAVSIKTICSEYLEPKLEQITKVTNQLTGDMNSKLAQVDEFRSNTIHKEQDMQSDLKQSKQDVSNIISKTTDLSNDISKLRQGLESGIVSISQLNNQISKIDGKLNDLIEHTDQSNKKEAAVELPKADTNNDLNQLNIQIVNALTDIDNLRHEVTALKKCCGSHRITNADDDKNVWDYARLIHTRYDAIVEDAKEAGLNDVSLRTIKSSCDNSSQMLTWLINRSIRTPHDHRETFDRMLMFNRILGVKENLSRAYETYLSSYSPTFADCLNAHDSFSTEKDQLCGFLLSNSFGVNLYEVRDQPSSKSSTHSRVKRATAQSPGDLTMPCAVDIIIGKIEYSPHDNLVIVTRAKFDHQKILPAKQSFELEKDHVPAAVVFKSVSRYEYEMVLIIIECNYLSDRNRANFNMSLKFPGFTFYKICSGLSRLQVSRNREQSLPLYPQYKLEKGDDTHRIGNGNLFIRNIFRLSLRNMLDNIDDVLAMVNPGFQLYMNDGIQNQVQQIDINSIHSQLAHILPIVNDLQINAERITQSAVSVPTEALLSKFGPIYQLYDLSTSQLDFSKDLRSSATPPSKIDAKLTIKSLPLIRDVDELIYVGMLSQTWYVFAKVEGRLKVNVNNVKADNSISLRKEAHSLGQARYTNIYGSGAITVNYDLTVEFPRVKYELYITQLWGERPHSITAYGGAQMWLRPSESKPTVSSIISASIDVTPSSPDIGAYFETQKYGNIYAAKIYNNEFTNLIWNINGRKLVRHVIPNLLEMRSVMRFLSSTTAKDSQPYLNRNILENKNEGDTFIKAIYRGDATYDLSIDISVVDKYFSNLDWETVVKFHKGFRFDCKIRQNDFNVPMYRTVASSILNDSAYKLGAAQRLNNLEKTYDRVEADLNNIKGFIDHLVNRKQSNVEIASNVLSNLGMVLSLAQPEIGMLMLGASAITNLAISDDPTNVINSLTQIGFCFHTIISSPQAFKIVEALQYRLNEITSTDRATLFKSMSKLHPFTKWIRVSEILDEFKAAFKKQSREVFEMATVHNILEVKPHGVIKLVSHDYLPTGNETTTRMVNNTLEAIPPLASFLSRMNISPEHAKVKVIINEPEKHNILARHHYVFGVADYVGIRREIQNDNRITVCGIPTKKRSFDVGGVNVIERFHPEGTISYGSYIECGYTEAEALSIVNEVLDEVSLERFQSKPDVLWRKLSQVVSHEEFETGERVNTSTSIPYPSKHLCDGLINSLKESHDAFRYDLITNNCQVVAKDITRYLTKLERPSWMSESHFSHSVGQVVGSMLESPV